MSKHPGLSLVFSQVRVIVFIPCITYLYFYKVLNSLLKYFKVYILHRLILLLIYITTTITFIHYLYTCNSFLMD